MMSVPAQTGDTRQVGQPQQNTTVGPATRWISISAGGNDVGFGNLGTSCAVAVVSQVRQFRFSATPCSTQIASAETFLKSDEMRTRLKTLYLSLLTNAPNSVVTVVGYPRVFPSTYQGLPSFAGSPFCVLDHFALPIGFFARLTLDIGMPPSDAAALDQFIVDLNGAAQSVIDEVRQSMPGEGYRLQFADTYAQSTPHNCKGTTPGATVAAFELSPTGRGIGNTFPKRFVSTATFHPTNSGQTMFAHVVNGAFEAAKPVITSTGGSGPDIDQAEIDRLLAF
jgi:hypothetical protein